MGVGTRTNEYGQVSDKPSEGNFREQFPSTEKKSTVDNTKKETSSNNSQKSYKKKTLSYPLARRNESKTDYLQIEIADYQAPKLNLPAFQDSSGKKMNYHQLWMIKIPIII